MEDTDLAPGHVRVYAHCGLPGLRRQRWGDVPADHPQLAAWTAAGLVATVGPGGEPAPARMPVRCCGGR